MSDSLASGQRQGHPYTKHGHITHARTRIVTGKYTSSQGRVVYNLVLFRQLREKILILSHGLRGRWVLGVSGRWTEVYIKAGRRAWQRALGKRLEKEQQVESTPPIAYILQQGFTLNGPFPQTYINLWVKVAFSSPIGVTPRHTSSLERHVISILLQL